MKKTISAILIFLLIFYMLTKPAEAVAAAGNGLVLWYQTILPTLLPFAVLSNLFISSNMFYMLSRFLYPIVRLFLPVSREGTFPVFAGFLFGFPMGSRISAVMLSENKLSYEEASVIFAVTNNMSPVFISSFILHHALKLPQLVIPTFIALYLPAILLGRLLFYRQKKAQNAPHKNTAPGFQVNFKIMDAAIMNGFETLTKLGGYIMLFSIIASLMNHLPLPTIGMKAFAVGLTEITNGIQFTALTPSNPAEIPAMRRIYGLRRNQRIGTDLFYGSGKPSSYEKLCYHKVCFMRHKCDSGKTALSYLPSWLIAAAMLPLSRFHCQKQAADLTCPLFPDSVLRLRETIPCGLQ